MNNNTNQTLQIFTDASFLRKDTKGCGAILIPKIDYQTIIKLYLPASSTNLELFTIMKVLETFLDTPNIEILTDSKSAILAIQNFKKKPCQHN